MTRTLRVLRQIIAPAGKHRPRRAVLLPDEPIPARAEPITHSVLDEAQLLRILHDGTVEVLESANCPCCDRHTAHARQDDGWLRCWTCSTKSRAGGQ